jgi:hypothetical protein
MQVFKIQLKSVAKDCEKNYHWDIRTMTAHKSMAQPILCSFPKMFHSYVLNTSVLMPHW